MGKWKQYMYTKKQEKKKGVKGKVYVQCRGKKGWGQNKGGVIISRLSKGEVVTISTLGLLKGEFLGQF